MFHRFDYHRRRRVRLISPQLTSRPCPFPNPADDVQGKCAIYPGIDIDVPTGKGEKQTTPDDVYASTTAALRAGAQGVIFSRKYSEMRLANLAAGGKAVKEFKG